MRLLVINFEMDEDSLALAWQVGVVNALAKSCESVLVLTERVGRYTVRLNVTVVRFQPRPYGIPYRLGGCLVAQWQWYRRLKSARINACFIHMNHPWAYRLYPTLRALRIPTLLWYAHGSVTPSLRRALRCATRVVTSSPEGFRIPSPKIRVIGQGIDTQRFHIPKFSPERNDILYVGRISRRKRINFLLDIISQLNALAPGNGFCLRLIGTPLTPDDEVYVQELRAKQQTLKLGDQIQFMGFLPAERIAEAYATAFLHVSVSETGSMDKAVLEALACGCPILTSNIAFQELLREHPEFFLATTKADDFARRIIEIQSLLPRFAPVSLRSMVEGKHDLMTYVGKILTQLQEIQ